MTYYSFWAREEICNPPPPATTPGRNWDWRTYPFHLGN